LINKNNTKTINTINGQVKEKLILQNERLNTIDIPLKNDFLKKKVLENELTLPSFKIENIKLKEKINFRRFPTPVDLIKVKIKK
jgi:hypothetical protein